MNRCTVTTAQLEAREQLDRLSEDSAFNAAYWNENHEANEQAVSLWRLTFQQAHPTVQPVPDPAVLCDTIIAGEFRPAL